MDLKTSPDPFLADSSVPIYTSADYLLGDRTTDNIASTLGEGNANEEPYGTTNGLLDLLLSTNTTLRLPAQDTPDTSDDAFDSFTTSSEGGIRLGGPRSVEGELEEERTQEDSLFGLFDDVLEPWYEFKNDVNEGIGLQFSLEYAVLLQSSNNTIGSTDGEFTASGMFQFQGTWALLGRNLTIQDH